jgi:hypothetical protein
VVEIDPIVLDTYIADRVDGARVLARLLAAWPPGGFDGRR